MTEEKSATESDSNISDMKSPEHTKAKKAPSETKAEKAGIGGPSAAEVATQSAADFEKIQEAKQANRDSKSDKES